VSLFALTLVLVAAVVHASWNLLAKRAGGGATFLWLFSALATLIYLPITLGFIVYTRPSLAVRDVVVIAGSGTLHLVYFVLLQRGYQRGDLSLVYPLARGTGPVLATLAAIVFLNERPGPIAIGGALLIGLGVVRLTWSSSVEHGPELRAAIRYGLLTGLLIAIYTIWDRQAVAAFFIPPLLLDWGAGSVRTLILLPVALRNRPQLARLWRDHRNATIGVALLSPLSYILVLTALTFTPVSYIAPAREISILIGTAMGTRFLAEKSGRPRLIGAGAMVLGIIALALG